MTLPYLLRLLCLCFSFFFLMNVAITLLVRTFSKAAIRFAATQRSAAAAQFLLALRLLPFALAALFVLVLCVPSYLRLEPAVTAERVGLACMVFGTLGFAAWSISITRAARALFHSFRYQRRFAGIAERIYVREARCSALVIETDQPLLALSGLLHPRLLIARTLLQALSAEELDAVFSHEHAHRVSRDNLKRLLFLVAPDAFPFANPLRALEQSWSKFAEWAADDRAAAGNSSSALSLAAALLRVARLGATSPLPYLSTSLLAGNDDLQARVNRLLHPALTVSPSLLQTYPLLRLAVVPSAICCAILLFAPSTLSFVHELQELLLR